MRAGRKIFLVLTALAALLVGGVAWAYLSASTSGTGGVARAASVQQGATPTGSASLHTVSLTWGASTLSNGHAVDGYVIKRYPAAGGSAQTVHGTCASTVAGLACSDSSVPAGNWQYTVTPAIGTNWRGQESSHSGTISVGGATLSLDQTRLGSANFSGVPATATLTGTLSGFDAGETITFHLDSATGTTLAGTPASANSSGNATVSIALPQPAEGSHTIYAVGDSAGANSSAASAAILIDLTAPSVSAATTPAPNAAGWNSSSPVTVTLTATDGGSGLNQVRYTTNGTNPTTTTGTVYSAPISIGTSTTVKYLATDNAGNVSAVNSQVVKIDVSAPVFGSPPLTLSGATGPTFTSGTTAYINPQGTNSGSFAVTAANVADPESGVKSVSFPALTGITGGGSVTSAPYTSTYSWTASSTASGSQTVTAFNNADSSATTTFTVTPDTTSPTSGSIVANSSAVYSTTGTVGLAVTNFSDAGSGIATNAITRGTGTLTGDTCGTITGATSVTISGGNDSATLANGCYRYTLTGTDNVGNQQTVQSAIVKVDTTGPSNTLALSNATGSSTFLNGTVAYYRPGASNSGAFTVTSSSTDAETNVQKVNFPGITGFGVGGDDLSSPYSANYSWTGSPSASGSQTVTATNNAGGTATSTFTLTQDTTGPTGGTVSAPSTNTTGVFTVTRTDYSADAGSGVASSSLTRATATLTGTTCGTFGTETAQAAGNVNESGLATGCYRYTLTGTDNVGNVSSTSVIVQVTVSTSLSPTALTIANGSGTSLKPDNGDVITITWNAPILLSSVCSTWSTTSQTVTGVSVTMAGANGSHNNDLMNITGGSVSGSACSGGVKVGTFTTTSSGYDSSNTDHTFSNSSLTWSAAANKLTLTLGTPSPAVPGTPATSVFIYTPASAISLSSTPSVKATGTASTGTVPNF
jgi:hypothetical protein